MKPTDAQIEEEIVKFARERGPNLNLTYKAGRSYELHKATGAAMNFALAIIDLALKTAQGEPK